MSCAICFYNLISTFFRLLNSNRSCFFSLLSHRFADCFSIPSPFHIWCIIVYTIETSSTKILFHRFRIFFFSFLARSSSLEFLFLFLSQFNSFCLWQIFHIIFKVHYRKRSSFCNASCHCINVYHAVAVLLRNVDELVST